tara:strand:+ start:6479 stop:7135 length:657 start_codon:yes stop_codon:yes gene_type:complete
MKTSDFYDHIMPRITGAEEPLVLQETFSAIRQLCEEGWAWPVDYGPFSTTAGSRHIYLNPMPENSVVGYVLQVIYEPSTGGRVQLGTMQNVPPANEPNSSPRGVYMEDTGTMVLYPTPDTSEAGSIRVSCTTIPTLVVAELPEMFMTHYRDAVIDTACHRLMMMDSKPWSSPTMAMFHGRRSRNHIKRIRDITKRRYSMGSSQWQFPDFAMQGRGGIR